MKLFLFTSLVAATTCSAAVSSGRASDLRYLQVFTGEAQTGVEYVFTDNSPDLSEQGLDNVIMSGCETGVWFVYDLPDYQGFRCGFYDINACHTWGSSCTLMVSSIRYAGSPNGLNDNYYNLYDIESFRGEEFGGNSDLESLGDFDLRTSSVHLSGQSEWTLYTGQGFTGPSVCVVPTDKVTGTDGIVMDFINIVSMSDIGLPDNSIRSIARGCLSDRVVGGPRFNNTAVPGL